MRHTEAYDRCDRHDDLDAAAERPRHGGLDRRHVADHGHRPLARPLGQLDARRTHPADRAPPATRHLRGPRPGWPASGPTPPTARRRAARPRRCRTTARSTARPPRTAASNARAVCWARNSGLEISSSTGPTSLATAIACASPTSSSGSSSRPWSLPAALSAVRPWRTRISTLRSVSQPSRALRRADRSSRNDAAPHGRDSPELRHTQTRIARPTSSSGTFHQPRSTSGSSTPAKLHPPAGHQNRSLSIHAPSKTRCSSMPIGSPSSSALAGRRPERGEHHDGQQEQAEHERVQDVDAARRASRRAAGRAPTTSSR